MSAHAGDTGLAGVGIERTSTVEQVVHALRRAILNGDLPPGTPLRETALADRFEVSRGTVREALRVLEPEGLIEHRAHRGAVVAALDPLDVIDVYRARLVVEVAAAERASEVGPDGLAGLRRAVDVMRGAAAGDEVADYVEAHAEFHRALVGVLESHRLARFAGSLQSELRLGFAVLDRMSGTLADSATAHEQLLDTMAHGGREAARQAVLDHLRHGAEDVVELPGATGS